MKNRSFLIKNCSYGKLLVSIQYRKLPTQQNWRIIVWYRSFRFYLKCTKNRKTSLKRNKYITNINLVIAKPTQLQLSSQNHRWHQIGYETKWTYNGCFYQLFKSFDTIDFFTLIQKMHSLNFSTNFLYWVFNDLTHRQHFYKSTQIVHLF